MRCLVLCGTDFQGLITLTGLLLDPLKSWNERQILKVRYFPPRCRQSRRMEVSKQELGSIREGLMWSSSSTATTTRQMDAQLGRAKQTPPKWITNKQQQTSARARWIIWPGSRRGAEPGEQTWCRWGHKHTHTHITYTRHTPHYLMPEL